MPGGYPINYLFFPIRARVTGPDSSFLPDSNRARSLPRDSYTGSQTRSEPRVLFLLRGQLTASYERSCRECRAGRVARVVYTGGTTGLCTPACTHPGYTSLLLLCTTRYCTPRAPAVPALCTPRAPAVPCPCTYPVLREDRARVIYPVLREDRARVTLPRETPPAPGKLPRETPPAPGKRARTVTFLLESGPEQ